MYVDLVCDSNHSGSLSQAESCVGEVSQPNNIDVQSDLSIKGMLDINKIVEVLREKIISESLYSELTINSLLIYIKSLSNMLERSGFDTSIVEAVSNFAHFVRESRQSGNFATGGFFEKVNSCNEEIDAHCNHDSEK